jgi:subtilase family serine protease
LQRSSSPAPGRLRPDSSSIRSPRAILGVSVLLAVLAATALAVLAPVASARSFRAACGTPAPRHARCDAEVVTSAPSSAGVAAAPLVTAAPSGYGPSDLASAYNLLAASGAGAGAGQTVAIVDAYDDPNAEADLGVYRSRYGLTACTTANGCFRKVNQTGGTTPPAADAGWAQEISLDLDMVAAICPNCHILLVEASSSSFTDLAAAVDRAVTMGATQVSNSYGGSEYSGEVSGQSHYNHPGVDITVSTGDSGYGVQFPASSQYVTAVGGTSLSRVAGSRGWSEVAWSGAGSGCSAYISKPSWQTDTGCAKRAVADVSAVADPNTGVAVYDSYGGSGGWMIFGGTSVAAPVVASIDALAGGRSPASTYGSFAYNNRTRFNDVTSGSNGSCGGSYLCTGVVGYDGPTGIGTPNGVAGVPPPPTNDFSMTASPSSGSVVAGGAVGAQVTTAVTSGTAQSVTLSAAGLPAGVTASFSPAAVSAGSASTITLSTASTTSPGSYSLTITGQGASASHSATFTLTVTAPTTGAGVLNGGFETGTLSSWTPAGTAAATTLTPHLGSFDALLGSTAPTNGDSKVTQTFSVPTGATSLKFWYQMSCPDTVRYDWATATLVDLTSGATSTPLAKTCATSSIWKQVAAAVTAGHRYKLTLISHDDNYAGDPTHTSYDDVSLS